MYTERSATAAVVVAVDPGTAFKAFTEEIDSWWVRGPINFFDAQRAVAMHVEPGVGGRVLEIYDTSTGDSLEIARIRVWEPGKRLVYRGSNDDTETDISFDAIDGGTRVRVHQYLLPGGSKAFLFWPNVLDWIVPWCEQRVRAPH
jgi:hypothetical protein